MQNLHGGINPWRLDKDPSLRAALVALQAVDTLDNLQLDQENPGNAQALWLHHRQRPGLNAYLFIYGQKEARYGLELNYPAQDSASQPAYGVQENLSLGQLVELLQMHFAL